jgi:hypothetical protein
MKKMTNKILASLLLLSTMVGFAGEFKVVTHNKNKKISHVSFDKVNSGSQFYIKDQNGYILYSEKIETTGTYAKKFDLSGLPMAEYYFELEKPTNIRVIPFTVEEQAIVVESNDMYGIVKPGVQLIGNRLYLKRLSVEEEEWKIKIYYEGEELIFSDKLHNEEDLKRVYILSEEIHGKYSVVISSKGRSYSYNFTI